MGGAAALRARSMEAKVTMAERSFNLVEPLAHKATAMRTTDTTGSAPARSRAVSHLSNRVGDVDRSMFPAGPGIRTSTTATRTTTTRTTSSAPEPSADRYAAADLFFAELVQAYFDCRRTKRNSNSALAFEANLERNLRHLYDELVEGAWAPGRSICFVVTHPKPREVWASGFRDRIVHHLLCNRVAPRFYAGFTADTCACIPGRGTLYGAKRLESQVRSITQNWSVPAHYMKLDLSNFFVSIRKAILRDQLARRPLVGVRVQRSVRPGSHHAQGAARTHEAVATMPRAQREHTKPWPPCPGRSENTRSRGHHAQGAARTHEAVATGQGALKLSRPKACGEQ